MLNFTTRRVLTLVLSTLLLGTTEAVCQDPPAGAHRWIVVFAGGPRRPAYTTADLISMIGVVDTAGRPAGWLCDGAIFSEFKTGSNRYLQPWVGGDPSNGSDWTTYLDSIFRTGGPMNRLDSAVAGVTAASYPLSTRFAVMLMIPYPDPKSGTLQLGTQSFDMSAVNGRAGASLWFVHEAQRRFQAANYSHLRLTAVYWVYETIPPSDSATVAVVAAGVHQSGLRYGWIPYFTSKGLPEWRALGFDEVWYQPNYFFHPEIPSTRLDSAVAIARREGVGLELEFDPRMLVNGPFMDRLEPYLAALESAPDLQARSIVIYDGAGALAGLARSKLEWYRALYDRMARVLRWTSVTPAHS